MVLLPLSLVALEETVAGLADLARLVERLVAVGRRKDPPQTWRLYRPGAIGDF